MQQYFESDSVPPLDQRLTLVLITHNQPAFLRRALRYYRPYPCKLLVLDSSDVAADGIAEAYPQVDYQHLPHFAEAELQAKLAHGVSCVTTAYMLFAADEDFIVHGAMSDSLSFLESHPDYSVCYGYSLMYLAQDNCVRYYLRDKKAQEDYAAEQPLQRAREFLSQFTPPFHAVTRTALLREGLALAPVGLKLEWAEMGHAYFLLVSGKARILPIAYNVRALNASAADPNVDPTTAAEAGDASIPVARAAFADMLTALSAGIPERAEAQIKQLALECFYALLAGLVKGDVSIDEPMFESRWTQALEGPKRLFGPVQHVEMPFYNQLFFDQLTRIEFLIHAIPASRLQLQMLEGVWVRQAQLVRASNASGLNANAERLRSAMALSPFDKRIAEQWAQTLRALGEHQPADLMADWVRRLDSVASSDRGRLLDGLPSGRLLNWLQARTPSAAQVQLIDTHLDAQQGGPQFCILVLNLSNDAAKCQATLDSLSNSPFKAYKVVVFSPSEPLIRALEADRLHFVKVRQSNYVAKLNQVARQTSCEWLMLAEAGDQFTPSGLLLASLELLATPECRAVSADDIQRRADGTLIHRFRPGFNLDLMQALPALMARHWLIRKDVFIDADGYSSEFSKALEFDLLLRIIERGGMTWLAHLDEPLLICDEVQLIENPHEQLTLSQHLVGRGYQAQVNSVMPGAYRVDYRHAERPMVSILLRPRDSLKQLKRCLSSVLLKTRYKAFEVLIVDGQDSPPEMQAWLTQLQQENARVRLLRQEQPLNTSALFNEASLQAKGEYLVLLEDDSEVSDPCWLDVLLNQAQRPEVGVVGAKLVDRDGTVTQAGLILGLNGSVGSAFVGALSGTQGYMHRLVLEQSMSAVSAACLMVRKTLFNAVAGLDEGPFAEAFSDVDLCLKIGQLGYMTIWTPYVEIIHPGTLPKAPRVLAALRTKWSESFDRDLAYNSNLALTGGGFTLGEVAPIQWAPLLGAAIGSPAAQLPMAYGISQTGR